MYLPILLEGDDGITHGNNWALGFMRGVHTHAESWRDLIDSDEYGGPMLTIMLLAHEHDPDPARRSPSLANAKREEMLQMMVAGLTKIYQFFEPHRLANILLRAPLHKDGPKVGRNDPCPCGSGRKFKHCCAAGL